MSTSVIVEIAFLYEFDCRSLTCAYWSLVGRRNASPDVNLLRRLIPRCSMYD